MPTSLEPQGHYWKAPTVATMRLFVWVMGLWMIRLRQYTGGKTPPYFLKPCVQIVPTTYSVTTKNFTHGVRP